MMPLIVTDAPLLASYSEFDFMFFLASHPDFGPLAGETTCCSLGHAVLVNGFLQEVACDKDSISQVLVGMFDAKLEMLLADFEQSRFSVGGLAACSSTILATGPDTRAEIASSMAARIQPYVDFLESKKLGTRLEMAVFFADVGEISRLAATLSRDDGRLSHQLIAPSQLGRLDVVKVLLDAKAVSVEEVNKVSFHGAAPLHHAAVHGHMQMVRWLLMERADVDGRKQPPNPSAGETPLHCAALRGHVECCEKLLQHQAEPSASNAQGETPLHSALRQPIHAVGSHEPAATAQVLRCLLDARSDPLAEDASGCKPGDLAVAWGVAWPPDTLFNASNHPTRAGLAAMAAQSIQFQFEAFGCIEETLPFRSPRE